KQAVDEMLMSSLQIADEWEMPGRFTKQCFMDDSVSYGGITRMVQWRKKDSECKAGFLRHSVCVLGTEDLPFIAGYHHILVNKMMPTFDYGAIACVSELLFNRTYLGQNDHPLDMTIYENLPTVRFHNGLNDTNLLCQNLHQL
uniref:Replicase n=1 Tax=Haemonchus contortus TaxID=6289 RepID=A0A7I4Y128_HAECO